MSLGDEDRALLARLVEAAEGSTALREQEQRRDPHPDAYGRDLPTWRNPEDRWGEYDRLDRRQPRRAFTIPFLLHAIPGALSRLRRVPAGAVPESGVDGDGPFAFVACPCGGRPVAREDRLEKCPGCERYYIAEEQDVFVFYGEMEPPPLPASEAA